MGEDDGQDAYLPDRRTIRRLAKAIRATWSDDERLQRAAGITNGVGDPPIRSPRFIRLAEMFGRRGGMKWS